MKNISTIKQAIILALLLIISAIVYNYLPHDDDCLCNKCETAYYEQREKDRK